MPGLVHGAAAVQQQVGQLHPTLIIALGGTGKEIALRLRQRFFEKYGVTGFPTVGYLWIDTDMQNNNIDNKSLDYIGAECLFRPGEYVDAQINGQTFQDLFTRSQFLPNIFKWIYPDLGAMGAVVDGAQATRPLGRLAFFKAFPTILTALGNQVAAISGDQAIQKTQRQYGVNIQPNRIEFKLLFSVAGGTGSGMFLDMAFLLRHLYQAQNPDIIGYLVLPCIFGANANTPRSQREYANGYAALKELEYYSMRKDLLQQSAQNPQGSILSISAHDFDFKWNDAIPSRPVMGPPFNTCYLISNRTETGGHIQPDEKTYLCDMLAESLFMDFHADAFSVAKRSVRSNLIQYLGRELEYSYLDNDQNIIHDEIFSCRFSTMGFSMIHVPLDRVRMACGYQLGKELLEQLLSEPELPADLNKHLREFSLQALGLRITRVADDFTPELTKLPNDLTFGQDLTTFWRDYHKRLLDSIGRRKVVLTEALDEALMTCQGTKLAKPRDIPQAWGEFPKALLGSPRRRKAGTVLSNQALFLQDRKARLEEQVRQWVKTDQVRFRGTLAYLEEIKAILGQHQQFFNNHAQQLEQEAAEIYDDYGRVGNILADEERRGRLFYHRDALKILTGEATELLHRHCELKMRSQVAEVCADICQELTEFVDRNSAPPEKQRLLSPGLMQQVEALRLHCLELRDSIATKLAAFEEQTEHFIFENVYHSNMINNFYQLQDGAGNQYPVDLNMMEEDFYTHFQISSPVDLLPDIQARGLDVVAGDYEDFCHQQFRFLTLTTDAVREFFLRYPTDQMRQQRLANFANRGMVWMRPGINAAADQSLRQAYTDWVALGLHSNPQNAQYQQVRQAVEAHLVHANLRRVPAPPVDVAPDAVYLYSERSGLPLPYIDHIEEYRQAYFSQLSATGHRLHIDRNESRFSDITVKNTQEVKEILESRRLLLLGSILRLISVEQDRDGQLDYGLLTGNPGTPRVPLGILSAAVENLRGNQTRRRSLARAIAHLGYSLTPEVREQFFTLLFYHISDGMFLLDPNDITSRVPTGPYPQRFINVGGLMLPKESLEHRVLKETWEEGCQQAGLGPDTQFRLIRAWYPRLDEFSLSLQDGDKTIRIFRTEALASFTDPDGLLPQNWEGNG